MDAHGSQTKCWWDRTQGVPNLALLRYNPRGVKLGTSKLRSVIFSVVITTHVASNPELLGWGVLHLVPNVQPKVSEGVPRGSSGSERVPNSVLLGYNPRGPKPGDIRLALNMSQF